MSGENCMTKDKEEKELLNKIIDLGLIYGIKDSEQYLDFLGNQINFYEHQNRIFRRYKTTILSKEKVRRT